MDDTLPFAIVVVFIAVLTVFIIELLFIAFDAFVSTEFITLGVEVDILLRVGKDENGMVAARSGVSVWNLHPRVGCREDSYN